MFHGIKRVTVIGAGVMGAAIAGHLANAGIPVHLLDVVPEELTAEEAAAGLTLESREVRNRIVRAGYQRMREASPAALYDEGVAGYIILGNMADDLEAAVAASDWIVEAIVERPGPKQALMARLEALAPPHAIITTNTSGIPIHVIAQGRAAAFHRRFLGAHFFNPPRYLRLLELIPTADTDPTLVEWMRGFAERRLGKGVVIAKDTPNFIANRMITFIQGDVLEFAIRNGYTVEEVDRLTGSLLGRPQTATFRLNDVIGIDVMALIGENLYHRIPDDGDRDVIRGRLTSAVIQTLLAHGLLGSKTGQGFYQRAESGGRKSFWGLDLQAAVQGQISYLEPREPRWASVEEVKDAPLAERLRRLVAADDEAGALVWHTLSRSLAYASHRIPEISDSPSDLDNAMRWGFGWTLGLFETWDALGVRETVARMEEEGLVVAAWVHDMLDSGYDTFYRVEDGRRLVYTSLERTYQPVAQSDRAMSVADLKRARPAMAENESASLLDMGDGVMLLEFHAKMNTLDTATNAIMQAALERLHGSAAGLVIGNQGRHFCAGANLFLIGTLAQAGDWEELDRLIRTLQQVLLDFRRSPKPVVAAPFQMTLGGGAEVILGTDRVVAHAESYIGLVEFGVGLIPAGGGCKEMVRRRVNPHMVADNVYPGPYLQEIFEQVGFARVSSSALEARQMGFLEAGDRIVMNAEHLLAEARREVLHMADAGYRPPPTKRNVYAGGRDHLANLRVGIHLLREGGRMSLHDARMADRLAYVLAGGDLSAPAWMDEQYFLDLEREAFKSLCGEPKTQERIWHMLKHGKPLRN